MKQIIPFKKELPFKTKVSDITSISLEREINVLDDGIVTGVFHITGDYKMNEGSINRENFSFDLPFDITLDPRYDVKTVSSDIEDFYYDVINEDTLKVNIDLYVEAEYLPESETKEEVIEISDDDTREEIKEDIQDDIINDNNNVDEDTIFEVEPIKIEKLDDIHEDKEEGENREETIDLGMDLFSNLDSTETYTTYYVYIVKEEDTIDKILIKYGITKEELESYNDITEIKPGDKVIIPKTSE
ncbi:MAG: LysM peptidoglycan-binding domain-containing protein [Bacilli bacterium]